eukprot:RCo036830
MLELIAKMSIYHWYLASTAVLFLLLTFCKPRETKIATSPSFRRFQLIFLVVYLIMMTGDWLQGPTVYRLYSYYGFDRTMNGVLFIAGFGSSMIFGTFAGTLADKYGRRLNCITYGVIYSLCCVTKHFNSFPILMLGRLLGGFATSILWSAFESWMVSEQHSRGFEESWVSSTFSLMTIGNGLVAIFSGFLAQGAVAAYGGHPVAPFDLSLAFLVLGTMVIMVSWTENFGESKGSMLHGLTEALATVRRDRKVWLLGALQSLFEGAMYTFVFMWTPALEYNVVEGPKGAPEDIPHGLIFSTFMICCSIGGSVFSAMVTRAKPEKFMGYVFAISAGTMAVPVLTHNKAAMMAAFCVYEVMVGMFWPGMGTMRSKYVPEEGRATILNLFRIPLNFLVCVILYYQGQLPVAHVFLFCVGFQLACTALMVVLMHATEVPPRNSDGDDCGTLPLV